MEANPDCTSQPFLFVMVAKVTKFLDFELIALALVYVSKGGLTNFSCNAGRCSENVLVKNNGQFKSLFM